MDRSAPFAATLVSPSSRRRLALTVAPMVLLAALLALLTIAIKNTHIPFQDRIVLEWVSGWDVPGIAGYFQVISFLTDNWPALVLGLVGIAFLWLLGMTREALGFAIVGGIMGVVALLSDVTLGAVVDRTRPLEPTSGYSYPSGHVFGSTAFFGFWGFLATHYRLKRRLLVPLLALIVAVILSTGVARIYQQAHWPSDVAAGYLLGVLWLLLLIPLFFWLQKAPWPFRPKLREDLAALGCETCRIERSLASVVLLDPQRGTATKMYQPPPLVRLLYWVSFQARFPYERNMEALQAAAYRRNIASLLTIHGFGKDLVAHVSAVGCLHGGCSFVTEYVPGQRARNDEATRSFLARVSDIFAAAGLSIWQINPRNPHAHTNLIRTPEGDLKIIDLESAVVTLVPPRGQWRSALRSGAIPVFDDIDFPRLRHYVAANAEALGTSLGLNGLAELKDAIARCEEAIRTWKDAEPRLWGRIISRVYRFLDWKTPHQHLRQALDGAERAGEAFLERGIERWHAESRLDHSEVAQLRAYLASDEVRDALHHLGAHLVMSVAIAVPVPGIRSLARFAWTMAFWAKGEIKRFGHRAGQRTRNASTIHSPLVMVLSVVPVFGGVAYLAARPLRRKLLVRLAVDQTVSNLPFGLYRRLHLVRWLAPPKRRAIPPPIAKVSTQNPPFTWRPSRLELLAFLLIAGLLSLLTYFGVTTDRQPWDLPITRAVQSIDLDRFGPFSQAIFWMGLRGFAGALLLAVGGALWLKGHRAEALFISFIGFFDLVNIPLRDIIGRPRPTPDLVGVVIGYGGIQGDSFPSGHSLHTMVFYGFLIYLSRKLMKPGLLRTGLWTLLGAYIPIAGLWLIYDGRHWASDVLGGYVYGAFYLMLLIVGYRGYLAWRRARSGSSSPALDDLASALMDTSRGGPAPVLQTKAGGNDG